MNWFCRLVSKQQRNKEPVTSVDEDSDRLSELNDQSSIAVAIGDHNFPDLHRFALGNTETLNTSDTKVTTRLRPSLADLLNPEQLPLAEDEMRASSDGTSAFDAKDEGCADGKSDFSSNVGIWEMVPGEALTAQVGDDEMDIDVDGTSDFASDGRDYEPCMTGTSFGEATSEGETSSAWGDIMQADEMGDEFPDVAGEASSEAGDEMAVDELSDREVEMKGKDEGRGAADDTRKRPRPSESSLSETENSTSESDNSTKARWVGKSRSGIAALTRRAKMRRGESVTTAASLEKWKNKLRADDPDVKFFPDEICIAVHSVCGRRVKMKDPCDATRWRDHIKACAVKKKPMVGMRSLFSMGWTVKTPNQQRKKVEEGKDDNPPMYPCPGLTEVNHERVPVYLQRTGVMGGGARSVKVIAGELYQKLFSVLGKKKKNIILDTQKNKHTWRNDHANSHHTGT